ncbi:MAG: RNA methyltransferase [Alphaproteobacteria bacterium]
MKASQTKAVQDGQPVIVLVRPQLGENIGTAARAMANFGLTQLRIVAPRDGWPSAKAKAAAAGADGVLDQAQIFSTAAQAVADLNLVFATSARRRDMVKPVETPVSAVELAVGALGAGHRAGFLFGPERTGLDSEEVVVADALVQVPTHAGFTSINLAQAVLVVAYEWFKRTGQGLAEPHLPMPNTRPATKGELTGLFEHLESELDAAGFLLPVEKRPAMVRNIRNLLHRRELTEQDVRTLRGVVVALTRHAARRAGAKGETAK